MTSQFLFILELLDSNDISHYFGWFFAAAIIFYAAYLYFAENNFWLSVLSNIACMFTVFFYFSEFSMDHYWFLENAEPLEWIGLVFLIIIFLAACFGMAKSHVFMIRHIFDAPIFSIISLVVGLCWAFTWFFAVGMLMTSHFAAALLALIAAVPAGSAADVPTIFVEGEGYVKVPGYGGGNTATSDYGEKYHKDFFGKWRK